MKKVIQIVVALLLSATTYAQTSMQRSLITIQLMPDHTDWSYRTGEEVRLNVVVLKDQLPQKDIRITYEWGTEKLAPTQKGDLLSKESPVLLRLKGSRTPGFMTCKATVQYEGVTYSNYINLAFDPERINTSIEMPDNFKAFWEKELKMAEEIPLRPQMTLMPDLCTPEANVYHVKFQINALGGCIYGMLSTPKQPGRYPAVLTVPGAGVRSYAGDKGFFPARGVITLEIGIHGIPVNLPQEVYNALAKGALSGYSGMDMDNRYHAYYKRVYLGCSRAVDFLASLPEVDPDRIAVNGGSQGGALSIVTAALNKRIKALVAFYPALCEIAGYYNGGVGGWPHLYRDEGEPNREAGAKGSAYFDVVNFARLVTQPGWYSWGFNDQTCPPTSIYCAYNLITAPKNCILVREAAHWAYVEQYNASKQWLLERLGE